VFDKAEAKKHFHNEMLDKREKLEVLTLLSQKNSIPDEEKAELISIMCLLTNLFVTADTIRELTIHSNQAFRSLKTAVGAECIRSDYDSSELMSEHMITDHLDPSKMNPIIMLSDVMGAMHTMISLYREEEELYKLTEGGDMQVNIAKSVVAHCKAKEQARKQARKARKALLKDKSTASEPRSAKKIKSKN